MTNDEPTLIFFRNRPSDLPERPALASSMQTLETVFILIAMYRFPHAFNDLGSAIENAIKACPDRTQPRNPAIESFKQALNSVGPEISPDIANFSREETLEFRKVRNRIEHEGYSPADDSISIDLMLRVGLPLLELCYRDLHRFELGEGLRADYELLRFLEASHDMHRAASDRSQEDYRYCLRGFQFLIRNIISPNFLSDAEYELLDSDRSGALSIYESVAEAKTKLINEMGSYWEFDCPVCNNSETFCAQLSFELENDAGIEIDFGICADCNFYIGSDEKEPSHSRVLLGDQISKQSEIIQKEYGL